MKKLSYCLSSLLLIFVVACGQKGPLYLPDESSTAKKADKQAVEKTAKKSAKSSKESTEKSKKK